VSCALTCNRAEWDTLVSGARKKWSTYASLAAKLPAGSISVAVPAKAVFDLKVDTADARLQIIFSEVRRWVWIMRSLSARGVCRSSPQMNGRDHSVSRRPSARSS
jgi:hypothetical protein